MQPENVFIVILLISFGATGSSQRAGNVWTTRGDETHPNSAQYDELLQILVQRYNSQNGTLSEEEFRYFWENLQGKGNETSKNEQQDPAINCGKNMNLKEQILCKATKHCLDSSELYQMASGSPGPGFRVDAQAFKQVCPLILYQLESGVCSISRAVHPEVKPAEVKKRPTTGEVWGYGVLFVTLISLSSLVGVSVMPLMGKAFYSKLLTGLVGLAVGSLSGSSVFHLIPQAFSIPDADPHHHYLQTSILIFAGVWLFFMIERFLKIVMDVRQRRVELEKNKNTLPLMETANRNNVAPKLANYNVSSCPGGLDRPVNGTAAKNHETHPHELLVPTQTEVEAIYHSQEQVIKASFGHQQKPHRRHSHEHMIHFKSNDSPIATVAWMIIFGDGLHNFIDGLSIGAAFNESIPTGISISVAVMCEELPHELGDFAVLLSAGMSMRQALLYNFLSACTCYVGLALGILLGEIEASIYIFALAGGMFLYISLVDMVPEMNEVVEEASKVSLGQALKVLLLQNIGVFLGVGTLYVLARYQDLIRFG